MIHPSGDPRPTSAEITEQSFTKSSFSGGQGSCVGIKRFGDWTVVGKHELAAASPTLIFPRADWDGFCALVARGERTGVGEVAAAFTSDGGFTLTETSNVGAPTIVYDRDEWEAFKLGVEAGELRSGDPRGTLVS
ncbi:uncharacterized protein DUF397 [Nocardiopsis sp. Huas11]|uniref:DUF397 domain-containing protein n=1 Tax=Nocardiopsis sp. Huas11 TaxID=2183912 RepID=UPI000EAFBD7C|nr:DUF397 domain-containing protein [Nocardiopsis sp. Huas11]RKS05908.1 uncharacterized protein DUF397 [Nocardiopsis sp. Huas11]